MSSCINSTVNYSVIKNHYLVIKRNICTNVLLNFLTLYNDIGERMDKHTCSKEFEAWTFFFLLITTYDIVRLFIVCD